MASQSHADTIRLSKFLSLVLRHKPEQIGMTLGAHGWVDIDQLLSLSAASCRNFSRDALLHVVETNDKKRFTLSADGLRIRAAQDHSVAVELGLEAVMPPEILFHGTAKKNLAAIFAEGLRAQKRTHVHLSADTETARRVGARHGEPTILQVATGKMHVQGHVFFRADNGVWLCASVPAEFLSLPAES